MADLPFSARPGTPVILTDDTGRRWNTTTRSFPWTTGDGTAIVSVQGIAGGYLLSRIEPGYDSTLAHFRDRKGVAHA